MAGVAANRVPEPTQELGQGPDGTLPTLTEDSEGQARELAAVLPIAALRSLVQLYAREEPRPTHVGANAAELIALCFGSQPPTHEEARIRLRWLLVLAPVAVFVSAATCADAYGSAFASAQGERILTKWLVITFLWPLVISLPLGLLYVFFQMLYACCARDAAADADPSLSLPAGLRTTEADLNQIAGVAMFFFMSHAYSWIPLVSLFSLACVPRLPYPINSFSDLALAQPVLRDYNLVEMTGSGPGLGLATQFLFVDHDSGLSVLPVVDPAEAEGEEANTLKPRSPNVTWAQPEAVACASFGLWALGPPPEPEADGAVIKLTPTLLKVRKDGHNGVNYTRLAQKAIAHFGLAAGCSLDPVGAEDITVLSLHNWDVARLLRLGDVSSVLVLFFALGTLLGFTALSCEVFVNACCVVLRHREVRYLRVHRAFVSSPGDEEGWSGEEEGDQ